MKFNNIKRIIAEDFPEEDRETISKVGFIINNALEQLSQILNKNLSITDNLNEQIVKITIKVDASGVPLVLTQVAYTLKGKFVGSNIVNVSNLDSPATYPTTAPFIIFEDLTNGLLKIKKVYGIQANTNYSFTVRLIGS